MHLLVATVLLFSIILSLSQAWPGEDKLSKKECKEKADKGDCEILPDKLFMKENCPATCREPFRKGIRFLQSNEPSSFFDLSAKTSDGKYVGFDRFDGCVTIVTDEQSLCGFTQHNFETIHRIHQAFQYTMEVLIFPTNQKKEFEGDECPGLQQFRNFKELNFLVMEAVNVNGQNTHAVYQYLKDRHHFDDLGSDYVTYFLVSPDGNVQVHEDIEPTELIYSIQYALKELL